MAKIVCNTENLSDGWRCTMLFVTSSCSAHDPWPLPQDRATPPALSPFWVKLLVKYGRELQFWLMIYEGLGGAGGFESIIYCD